MLKQILTQAEKTTRQRKLKCRCGLHAYKWSWKHLCKVCVFCGQKKQIKG